MAKLRYPVAVPTEDVTHVEVIVDYHKNSHTIRMYVHPVVIHDGMMSCMLFSGTSFVLEAAPRLNRKRLVALRDQIHAQIEARKGDRWNDIANFLRQKGIELADPEKVGA